MNRLNRFKPLDFAIFRRFSHRAFLEKYRNFNFETAWFKRFKRFKREKME